MDFKKSTFSFSKKLPKNISFEPIKRLSEGHILVHLSAGDQKNNGLFDTGASLTSVDSKYAQAHPSVFKLVSLQNNGFDINGSPFVVKIYQIDSLKIGNVTFKNILVATFDFGSMSDYLGQDVQFVIGNNIIAKVNWLLDLKTNRLIVSQKSLQ